MHLRCAEANNGISSLLKTCLMITNKRQVSTNKKHGMWQPQVPLGAAGWERLVRRALPRGSAAEERGDSPPPELLKGTGCSMLLPSLPQTGMACTPKLSEGLQKESSNPPNVSPPGLMAENYLGELWEVGDAWSAGIQGLLMNVTLRAPLLFKTRIVLK